MAEEQANTELSKTGSVRRGHPYDIERPGYIAPVPRLLWLLLVSTPLIVASSLLVPVDTGAAFVCWAAAGTAAIAWPWWQHLMWDSPPQPQRKTWLDRFVEGIGLCSAAGLGLIVLAWICGLL